MKTRKCEGTFLAAFLFLFPFVCAASQGDKASAVLQLRISSTLNTFKQGQPIDIAVQLTNLSQLDIFVGRDWWTDASPSHVRLLVTPLDGHNMGAGSGGGVSGVPAHAWDDLPKTVLKWGFLLPGGFSFGTKTNIGASDLSPGTYKISALYSSFGVDMNTHLNPALSNSAVLASLMPFSWKGDVASTIRVIGSHQGKQTK
jgi:hypothetical protein